MTRTDESFRCFYLTAPRSRLRVFTMSALVTFWILACFYTKTISAIPSNRQKQNDDWIRLQLLKPEAAFEEWMERFHRTYERGSEEFYKRYAIWLTNLHHTERVNKLQQRFWLTMTGFADFTVTEFKQRITNFRISSNTFYRKVENDLDVDLSLLPQKIDWRDEGVITKVKDQGACAACWAFSAVGSIEALNAMLTGSLVSLSEQELIDCDYFDDGCKGGFIESAFQWIAGNGGVTTAADYSFSGSTNPCHTWKLPHMTVPIGGYENVPRNESHLIEAIARQPVSVAINTDLESLLLYGGGIFDAECSSDINHAVIAVGYDLEEGYILIKNSWGESWGEDGYIRLALGLNDGDGQCGVATLASYPTVYLSSSDCNPSTKIQCSEDVSCQPDETCCCLDWNQGFCQHWECCPGNFGTCCADGKFCCPQAHPVCGPSQGYCMNDNDVILSPRKFYEISLSNAAQRTRKLIHLN